MGNDGGSIPKRRELVKEAARNPTATQIKETQNEQQEYFWTTDPLSRKPLARPIVSDCNGRLYNKDSVLEHLLAADTPSPEAEAILQGAVKSLKDVVELQLQPSSSSTTRPSRETWVCPITADELGPGSKAAYLVPCGHVFSGAALKEVAGTTCSVCDAAHAPNDVIPILPVSKEEIARLTLRARTLKEQGLTHSLRKLGKDKKKTKSKKRGLEEEEETPKLVDTANGINNAGTKALTQAVLAEQERKKKAKLANENLASLFSSRDKGMGNNTDFMTRGYQIPADARR